MEDIINEFVKDFNKNVISALKSFNMFTRSIKEIYDNIIQRVKSDPNYIYEIINYTVEISAAFSTGLDNSKNDIKINNNANIKYFIELEKKFNYYSNYDKEVTDLILKSSVPIIKDFLAKIIKQEFSSKIPTENNLENLLREINTLKKEKEKEDCAKQSKPQVQPEAEVSSSEPPNKKMKKKNR